MNPPCPQQGGRRLIITRRPTGEAGMEGRSAALPRILRLTILSVRKVADFYDKLMVSK